MWYGIYRCVNTGCYCFFYIYVYIDSKGNSQYQKCTQAESYSLYKDLSFRCHNIIFKFNIVLEARLNTVNIYEGLIMLLIGAYYTTDLFYTHDPIFYGIKKLCLICLTLLFCPLSILSLGYAPPDF